MDKPANERKKRERALIKKWLQSIGYNSMEGYVTAQMKSAKQGKSVVKKK